jgi:hypothetical protein
LTEAGTISGQIEWATGDGTSVPDYEQEYVEVVAIPSDESLAGLNFGPWNRNVNIFCRRVRPDADGRFTLTDVSAGRNALVVLVKNFPWAIQQDVMVPAGGTMEGLTLAIPPAQGQISGTVTVADGGTPLEGFKVAVCNKSLGLYRLQVQTDNQGRYTFSGLPAGTYQVLANVHEYSWASPWANQASAEITVGDEPVAGVDFRLSAGGNVTGTVVGPDGQPLADAQVSTAPVESEWPVWLPAGLSWISTTTDEDGAYTLEHLAPGEYTLYLSVPGCAEATREKVVVREGETTAGVDWRVTSDE